MRSSCPSERTHWTVATLLDAYFFRSKACPPRFTHGANGLVRLRPPPRPKLVGNLHHHVPALRLRRQHERLRKRRLDHVRQLAGFGRFRPQAVMDVLRWHVATQLAPEQADSDLLFPSITGGFRAACVLNKPFDDVSERLRSGRPAGQFRA
jgi:hypothetical protein